MSRGGGWLRQRLHHLSHNNKTNTKCSFSSSSSAGPALFFLVPSRSCAFQVGVSCMQHSLTPPHPFNNPPSPPCYNDRSAVAVRQQQQQRQRLSMEECSSSSHSRAFVVWNVSVWKKTCVYDGAIVCESQNHRGERVLARVCVCSSI